MAGGRCSREGDSGSEGPLPDDDIDAAIADAPGEVDAARDEILRVLGVTDASPAECEAVAFEIANVAAMAWSDASLMRRSRGAWRDRALVAEHELRMLLNWMETNDE